MTTDKPEYLSDEIYSNSKFLSTISNFDIDTNRTLDINNYGDSVNIYNTNSYGHRSEEFRKVDVLTAGCSYTFGSGIDSDGIWSTLLARTVGGSHSNLAIPGWSIESIVDNIHRYIYKFGAPKVIFVLFPDQNRLPLVVRQGFVTERNKKVDGLFLDDEILSRVPVKNRPKYSKAPHNLIDLTPPEYAIYRAFKSINFLISYCETAGVTLIWGTWHKELEHLILRAQGEWNSLQYRNFVSMYGTNTQALNKKYLDKETNDLCHKEYISIYGDSFFFGLDNQRHPGVHTHIHYYEKFYKKYEETLK